jgi:hypothetical protein
VSTFTEDSTKKLGEVGGSAMQKIDEAGGNVVEKVGNFGENITNQTANLIPNAPQEVKEGEPQQPVVVPLDSLTTATTPTLSETSAVPTAPAPEIAVPPVQNAA